MTKADGSVESEQGYWAYGRYRVGGTLPTDHKFTGQKLDGSGLYYMNARYYDPELGIFVSPDSIVPDARVLIDYNRYAYARANPMRFNDPTGHYGDDVHQTWTNKIAGQVVTSINSFFGLNLDQAKLADDISGADVGTDYAPTTRPDTNFLVPQYIQQYGEATPEYMTPTRYYHFMGQETAENRLTYAILNGDIDKFGEALHLFQDTFSHIESGFTLPTGAAGIADLQMCRGCDLSDPETLARAGGFLGHAWPRAGRDPHLLDAAAHTDDFTMSPRDIRMSNGTGFWIAMYVLVNAGKTPGEIDNYFNAQYGVTAQEFYQQNVLTEE